jgi:hypothetical protein
MKQASFICQRKRKWIWRLAFAAARLLPSPWESDQAGLRLDFALGFWHSETMHKQSQKDKNLLNGARAYLSGPMDFVASRTEEMKNGWRNRVGQFLNAYGVTVFDPWSKPQVRGLYEYGREGVETQNIRKKWTFRRGAKGAAARARCSGNFWETLHIDLRMVDTSDFVIAFCPTNIYSVGTPHEIIICRQQHKPVLFVSPAVRFPALAELREHLREDPVGTKLVDRLEAEVPIKPNPKGVPSLWYLPLVGGEHFFDGFGFRYYQKRFRWEHSDLDFLETSRRLDNPLLPFLERLSGKIPRKWNDRSKRFVRNDDWLLWDLSH